ncbi:glycosyltransferase family 4 protein [Chloroflexota bacterium]
MRILQVSVGYTPSHGGVATNVKNISERLAKKHQVTVFAENYKAMLPYEETINGVLVRRFDCFHPGAAYFLSPDMIKELRRSSFDIVHGHCYHGLPLYFSRYAGRKKFVVTSHYHGHGHTFSRSILFKLYKLFGRRIFNDADVIVAVSEYEKQILMRDFGLDESKLHLIPNGVVLDDFSNAGLTPRTNTIMYAGRLEKYKGIHYIIQALPLLEDDLCLEIVGWGTYEAELMQLVDRMGLKHRVSFSKLLSRSQLLKLYSQAQVFVVLSQQEAFSIVVAEALASKTPCVVARTSALKEWIDNKNCLGIDYPIDIRKLAETIDKARGIKVTDVKLWDWDDVTRALEDIYDLDED